MLRRHRTQAGHGPRGECVRVMVCFGSVQYRSRRRRCCCARRGGFRRPVREKLCLLHLDPGHGWDISGLFRVDEGGRTWHTPSFTQGILLDKCGGGGDCLLVLLLILGVMVVLFEADVPGQAAHRRHSLKLVHHAARDVVDVVVIQLDASVSDALTPQLVQLGIIHPLDTLRTSTDTSVNSGHIIR